MEELDAEPPLEKTGKVLDELNSYKAPVKDSIPAEDYQMHQGISENSCSNAFACAGEKAQSQRMHLACHRRHLTLPNIGQKALQTFQMQGKKKGPGDVPLQLPVCW